MWHVTLLILLLSLFSPNVRAKTPSGEVLIEELEIVRDVDWLRNQLKLYDIRMYQKAYVNRAVWTAYERGKQSAYLRQNPKIFRELIFDAYDKAKAEALGESWRGGLRESMLKAGVAGTAAYSAALVVAPVAAGAVAATAVLGEFAIGQYLDKNVKNESPSFPNAEETFYLNMWSDQLRTSGEPFMREFFVRSNKEIEGRDVLVVDDNHDPDVVAFRSREQVMRELSQLDSRVAKVLQDGKVTRLEYQNLKREMEDNFSDLKTQSEEDQRSLKRLNEVVEANEAGQNGAEKTAEKKEMLTSSFAFMTNLAIVFGDTEAARTYDKAGQLSSVIFDIANFKTGTFAANPLMVANSYMLAANLALSLIQGAQPDPQFTAIMAQLRQIAQQIEQMRREMHERFDRLESQVDVYFGKTLIDLNNIEGSQNLVREQVILLQARMEEIRARIDGGLSALGQMQLVDWESDCFAQDKQLRPLGFRDVRQAGRCFTRYSLLGLGRFMDALKLEGDASPVFDQVANRRRFAALTSLVSKSTYRDDAPDGIPEYFIYGADKWLELMRLNPAYRSFGVKLSRAVPGNYVSNYQALLTKGENLEKFMQSMALEVQGQKYVLRRAVFNRLLEQYEDQAHAALQTAQSSLDALQGRGPHPTRGWSETIPIIPAKFFQMFDANIGLCKGTKVKVGLYEVIPSPSGTGLPRYPWSRKEDGTRQKKMHSLDPAAIHVNARFFPLLPASVVWANRMGETNRMNVEVKFCFSEAKLNSLRVLSTEKKNEYDISLTMDVSVAYTNAGKRLTSAVAQLSGRTKFAVSQNDPLWGASPITSSWSGDPRGGDGVRLMPWPNGIYGIENAPDQFFKRVPASAEQQKNLSDFEIAFTSVLESQRKDVQELMSRANSGPEENIDSIVWQISYLIREGLSLNHQEVSDLYTWIHSGSLPTARELGKYHIDSAVDVEKSKVFVHRTLLRAKDLLDAVEAVQDLTPPPSKLKPTLTLLRQYL